MENQQPEWMGMLKTALEKETDYQPVDTKKRRGLYMLLFKRLKELDQASPKDLIPFPEVFKKLCKNFSMSKKECWDILFLLRDFGLIDLIPFHGIKMIKEE